MTTPAATALGLILASRDAANDAPIWTDNGATITRLAALAGVQVTYLHCDLTAQRSERRTVGGTDGQGATREGGAVTQKAG